MTIRFGAEAALHESSSSVALSTPHEGDDKLLLFDFFCCLRTDELAHRETLGFLQLRRRPVREQTSRVIFVPLGG